MEMAKTRREFLKTVGGAALGSGLVLFAVCGWSQNKHVNSQLSREDQIRVAVFRYQFEFNASALGKAANAYYLSVGHYKDPSPELLNHFAAHHPVVKPVSASTLEPGTVQVLDKLTGLPGLIFRITEIRWLSDDEVEVDGGYYEASGSATGNTYSVVKEAKDWSVVR